MPYSATPDAVQPDDLPGLPEDKQDDREWRKRRVKWGSPLHDKLCAKLRDDMNFSMRGKLERDEMGRRAYKAYRCSLDPTQHQMAAKVIDPRFFTAAHTSICREAQALFENPTFLRYAPRGASDTQQARTFSALFDYFWSEREPYEAIVDLLTQRTIFGTAYCFFYWREDWRSIGRFEETMEDVTDVDAEGNEFVVGQTPVRNYVVKPEKKRDAPWFDVLHFLEVYPDWESPTIEDARFFIHSKFRSREYLRMMAKSGAWDKSMVMRALESPWNAGNNAKDQVNSVIRWQQEIGMLNADSITLADCGELFEVTYRLTQKGFTTYINRSYIVDHGPNPYAHGEIPVAKITSHPMPGEHFGMSVFEPIEPQLIHLNTMASASATEAKLSVHPVLQVGPGVKIDQLVYSPGKIWRTTDPSKDIVPLVRPSQGIEVAERQASQARAIIDDALATSEALRGTLPGREQTAAAVNVSEKGADIRMRNSLRLFRTQFSTKCGEWYRSMLCQFLDKEVPVKVTEDPNAPAVMVGPDQIYDLDLDTIVMPNDAERDELQVKRLIDYVTTCLNFKVPNIDAGAAMEVVAELLIPSYASRVIKSPERMQQEQQEAMMQQQQQQAQQAQQGAAPGQNNFENQRGAAPPSGGGRASKGNDGGVEQMAKESAAAQTL